MQNKDLLAWFRQAVRPLKTNPNEQLSLLVVDKGRRPARALALTGRGHSSGPTGHGQRQNRFCVVKGLPGVVADQKAEALTRIAHLC